MSENTEINKLDLELREHELKVRELDLKVKDLEKPSYKKISFWTSLITVCIAIIGIIGQSFLSNIKNAQAKLETEKAKKEMGEATEKINTVNHEIQKRKDSILILQITQDTLQKNLKAMLAAYNDVSQSVAYSKQGNNDSTGGSTNTVVTNTNKGISNILLNNASELLLKSSILKVYYIPSTKERATKIDSILKSHGVKSEIALPGYDISKANNQIVYYNPPQENYCIAVKDLLQKSGQGIFSIRLTSDPSATISYFKIYISK